MSQSTHWPSSGSTHVPSSRAVAIALASLWLTAIVLLGAHALLAAGAGTVSMQLDPSRMSPELGRAFEIPIRPPGPWWYAGQGDTLAAGEVSDLELTEDDRALGPAHARHPDIRERGAGRFSHWHGRLIFSTSDGSDPRVSGRRYTVRFQLAPVPWIETVGTIALAFAAVLSWWRFVTPRPQRGRLAFFLTAGALIIVWNGVIAAYTPGWIAVQDDSMSYLNGSSMRTIGYPLLLRAVASTTGDLSLLARLQINALLGSIIFLAAGLIGAGSKRAAQSYGWSVIALLLMGTTGRVFEASFSVMADGPFTAFSCFAAGLLAILARRVSVTAALAVGVTVAIAILIRPVGFAFIPALLLPWWWHRRSDTRPALRLLLPAFVPLMIILGSAALHNRIERGSFGFSTMGPISLAGHVAWMISPETVPAEPKLAARIEARLAPVIARRPALAWPLEYYLYTSDEYNELLYRNLLPEVDAWLDGQPGSVADRAAERSRLLQTLGTSPVLHRPGTYARHVAANIAGAWHWSGRAAPILPSLARSVQPGVESFERLEPAHRALFEGWLTAPAPDRSWQRALLWERWRHSLDARPRAFAIAAATATLLGIALIPWSGRRRDDSDADAGAGAGTGASAGADSGVERSGARSLSTGHLGVRLLGALGMMTWGSIVLIALSATVIFRYVDALDPLLAMAIITALAMSQQAFGRWRDRSNSAPRAAA